MNFVRSDPEPIFLGARIPSNERSSNCLSVNSTKLQNHTISGAIFSTFSHLMYADRACEVQQVYVELLEPIISNCTAVVTCNFPFS